MVSGFLFLKVELLFFWVAVVKEFLCICVCDSYLRFENAISGFCDESGL